MGMAARLKISEASKLDVQKLHTCKLDAGYPESQTKKLFQKCWVNGRWINTYILVKVFVTLLGKIIFKRGTPTLSQRRKRPRCVEDVAVWKTLQPWAKGNRDEFFSIWHASKVPPFLLLTVWIPWMSNASRPAPSFQRSHIFAKQSLGNPKTSAFFSADV